ncbi:MAG: hypothetical protein ACR2GD_10430 [Pyrinomonadaceae bacterium]
MNQGKYNRGKKDTTKKSSDTPRGDGTVSDEDTKKITEGKHLPKKPEGQDHSLDNYEASEPTSGVGAIQSSSLIKENIAHIEGDEGE